MTNTCEIVHGKSDAEFGLGQETLQRPLRIYLKGLCWICVVLYMQGLVPHMTAQFSFALTHFLIVQTGLRSLRTGCTVRPLSIQRWQKSDAYQF